MFCRQGSRHGVTGRRRRWAGEANWNASRLPGGCGVRGPFSCWNRWILEADGSMARRCSGTRAKNPRSQEFEPSSIA